MTVSGIEITAELPEGAEEVVNDRALELIVKLHRALEGRRQEALAARSAREAELAAGGTLDFLPETENIRTDDSWQVTQPEPGLEDRRVVIEIVNASGWERVAIYGTKLMGGYKLLMTR